MTMPPTFDPFDDSGGAPGGGGTKEDDAREEALLLSYGFSPLIGGYWLAPDGATQMTKTAALKVALQPKVGADYAGQTSTGALIKPPTSSGGTTRAPARDPGQAPFTQNGVRYVWDDASGGFRPALAMEDGSPSPQATAQLQAAQADLLIKQQNLAFLREKQAFEMEAGRRREALDTQQQIFTQQLQTAQLENNIAQFNARMNVDVQQANFDNSEKYATRQQNLATQIGTLAQDAGDRGKYASTVLANSGWGADNSQTDYRTTESTMPLEQLLRIRANSMGGPTPITPAYVGGASGGVNLPAPGGGLSLPNAIPALPSPAAPAAPASNPYAPLNAMAAQQNAAGKNTQGVNVGADATVPGVPPTAPAPPAAPGYSDAEMMARILASRAAGSGAGGGGFSHGGMAHGMYVSGDAPGKDPSAGGARPELNIPLGDGRTAVLNEAQMDAMGINLKKVMKMAGGGIFDAMAGDNGDRSLTTDFLNAAATEGRRNTPWAGGGNLPSPVYGAAPGFDPIVLDLIASMNALERGYPAAAYKRQAALLQPAGVSEHAVRRSA